METQLVRKLINGGTSWSDQNLVNTLPASTSVRERDARYPVQSV